VRWVKLERLVEDDGRFAVRARVGTAEFGTLRGTVLLSVSGSGRLIGHRSGRCWPAGPVPPPTGLARVYDRWLAGRPAMELLFGSRVVARAPMVPGRRCPRRLNPG
jgi:hypothetical protein